MKSPNEIEALRQQVEAEKAELRFAVLELESAARRSIDPRQLARERPVAALGCALALGFWLGWRHDSTRERRSA